MEKKVLDILDLIRVFNKTNDRDLPVFFIRRESRFYSTSVDSVVDMVADLKEMEAWEYTAYAEVLHFINSDWAHCFSCPDLGSAMLIASLYADVEIRAVESNTEMRYLIMTNSAATPLTRYPEEATEALERMYRKDYKYAMFLSDILDDVVRADYRKKGNVFENVTYDLVDDIVKLEILDNNTLQVTRISKHSEKQFPASHRLVSRNADKLLDAVMNMSVIEYRQ